jgi:TatD DNase family protein
MIIDSHTHVSDGRFDEDRGEVLDRARASGVGAFIDIGCWPERERRLASVRLAEEHADVWSVVGVHPHDVGGLAEEHLEHVRELVRDHPRVVAVGETGLDFHYDRAPHDEQTRWFHRFLDLAGELDSPCVVHSRSADAQTVQVMQEAGAGDLQGVIHCFTGGPELAEGALELGWHIGFTGIVTFKSADNVVDAVRRCPMDRMLVETDAPYLAPIPHRGKRNEPAYLPRTVERIAEIKGMTAQEVAQATTANARRLFRLPVS